MNKLFIVSFVLIFLLLGAISYEANPVISASDNVCPEENLIHGTDPGWHKVEGTSPTYTAPAGYVIDQICVKGGRIKIVYTSDVSDSCWLVAGIGSQAGSATKVGEGSDCPDISHASFHITLPTPISTPTETPTTTATPTETPAPTDTPSATRTPTITPTVSPTVAPTRTPTDVPTDTPTPTIVSTPTVTSTSTPTEVPTVTPTEVPSETQTPTPTPSDDPGDSNITPTPTPTSSSGIGGSTLGDSTSNQSDPTSQKQGEVLGASTLAATGNFVSTIATIEEVFGIALIAIGTLLYGKKAKKNYKEKI